MRNAGILFCKMKGCKMTVVKLRCCIANYLYDTSDSRTKDLINADLKRLLKWNKEAQNHDMKYWLDYYLCTSSSYRSVFYFRVNSRYRLSKLCKLLLKPNESIEIQSKSIGGADDFSQSFSSDARNCW